MPQIRVQTGIDTKPVLMGVKELNSAVRSLTGFVNQAGKDMDASVVGFAKAMRNNAEASREVKSRVEELNATYKNLISRVDELANSRVDTQKYAELKKEIEATEKALQRQLDIQARLKATGKDAVPTKEYAALTKEAEKSREAVEQIKAEFDSKMTGALYAQSAVKNIQTIIDKEKERYRESARLANVAGRKSQKVGVDTEQGQMYQAEMAKYKAASEDAQKKIIEYSNTLKSAQADVIRYQNALDGIGEKLNDAETEYDGVISKQKELEGAGKAMRITDSMQKSQYEASKLQESLAKLNETKADMEKSGTATISGAETEEYGEAVKAAAETEGKLQEAIQQANQRTEPLHVQEWNQMATATGAVANGLARVQYAGNMLGHAILHPFQTLNRLIPMVVSGLGSLAQKALNAAVSFAKMVASNVISFIRRLGVAALNAAKNLARMAGQAIVSGIKKIGTMAAKAGKAILSVGKGAKQGNTSLKQAVTMLIRYGFGVRSIYMLVRRLRTALVDAFKNMAQAVPEVNVVMSRLSASLGQLKNSLATAFQPILSAIAPLLNTFMGMMTEAMTKVGMFFAALTGQDYVYKAAKANVDLAKSLDKTKKSAKEAENQLAGFDHLNILKAPNDSGSNTGSDTNAADGGGFQKAPLLDSIKNFANTLKDMLLNGEFAELGKVLAEKVNGLFNSIDLYGIAQKLGGLINNVVAFYNAFMEGIDWQNIGRKFADGINGLLDSVNWTELGRAFSQKINAIWGIIAGLVDKVEWDKLGTALADAVWGFFGNIKWDLIGETIGNGINGISTAIINFADTFPWKEAGAKIASGLNRLFDTVNLQTVVSAFLKLLNGALDSLLEIVGGFKWGENGEKFRLAVLDLIKNFPAEKLGHLLQISLKGILDLMAPTISDPKIWANLGTRLGSFLNSLFGDKEMWKTIGTIANGMLNGILTFGESFLATFEEDKAAENIKAALAEIPFDEIAENTWGLIKTAFSKAGSFVDTLFSESTEGLSGAALREANAFNAKPIGARIAEKIKGVFTLDLWKTIATDVWETAKKGFTVAGDFIGTLLGIDTANMNTKERLEAIGNELGKKLGEFANTVGAKLAEIPWGNIFSAAWEIIKETISGLISGLLGDESGNGQVLLWVAGGIIALKAGILPLLGKLITGLASGFAAGGPIMAAGLTAAFAAVATAGIVKLATLTVQLSDAQREMNEAFGNETETGLSSYVYLWKTYGKEAAEEFALRTYGFQTTNESLLENTQQFGKRIAEVQGTTYDNVNAIVSEALGTYKSIFKTEGAEAANDWANNALFIQTTGENLSENLSYLAEELQYQAGTSTEIKNTIHEACEGVKIDVIDASAQTEESVTTATENIESKTSEAAPDIEDNLTTPYSNAVPQVEGDMQAIYDAADNGLEEQYTAIEAGMNENAKLLSDKSQDMVDTTENAWSDITSTQSEALQGMTGNTESGMSQMTGDVSRGTTDQRQPVYDNWDLIATFVKMTLEGMKSDVQNAMTSMYNAVYSGMNNIVYVASQATGSLANAVSSGARNIANAFNNVDWWSVGDNIVAGIQDGMIDNWKWLQRTAKTLANNLLISTKNALGIASPSRLFRDEVGVMLGLGIAEGMEDSQPAIIDSVANVADAMADEMNGTDMAFNVGADAALDSFGDRITNSFTSLLDRLQTIADRVTFQTPTIATGTVLPYNVQAQSASGNNDIVNALEVSNDDLANVIIQATNNAVSALVDAIRRNGNTSGGDLNTQTSRIIDEINRRTRAQGTSPIIV